MSLSKKYVIDTGYVDKNLRLRISNLFLMFQEIAEEHAENIGIGRDKVFDVGRKWIITRHYLKIDHLPTYGDEVTLTTYPGKYNPYFYYRYFYLSDKDGKILARAASIWAIIDAKTNKVVVNAFDKKLPEESREDELPLPRKIEEDTSTKVMETKVQYSDIDLNGHLNNTRYIEYIQNIHDSSYYKDNVLDEVIVNYFSEIKENEIVSLYSERSDKKEIIKGAVDGRDCFKAIFIYK